MRKAGYNLWAQGCLPLQFPQCFNLRSINSLIIHRYPHKSLFLRLSKFKSINPRCQFFLPTVKGRIWFSARLEGCFSMEFCLLRLCIFQTALKNTFLWYYFLTLERAGKDMVSLGGSERIAEEYLIKIFEALFCAITILS